MKNKDSLKSLLALLLLTPLAVFASTKEENSIMWFAYIWVAFASLHWSLGVLKPLSEIINQDNPKKIFWILFVIRAVILLIAIPLYEFAFIIDFFLLFILAFVTSFVSGLKGVKRNMSIASTTPTPTIVSTPQGILVCPKCGRKMAFGNTKCVVCGTSLNTATVLCPKCNQVNETSAKFCKNCGETLTNGYLGGTTIGPIHCPKCNQEVKPGEKFCGKCGENVEAVVAEASKTVQNIEKAYEGTPVDKSTYNPAFFKLDEDAAIKDIIKKEIDNDPNGKGKSLPSIEKKKLVGTIIYSIICFILISIYVSFHTYLALGLVIWFLSTITFFKITKGYTIEKHLLLEVKKRPDEKISYIVSSTLSGTTSNKAIYILLKTFIMALWIIAVFLLYNEPHMIYEKTSEGYTLRYYTYGILRQNSIVEIPDTYKGEKVVGIRGDTFKNVRSLEEVTIPNSVTEIRGGTFEGCTNLKRVKLPDKIVRVGGAAFKDCSSLPTIDLPQSITEIGGEAFSGCTSLKEITLPENLLEIRGDTFNECSSLEKIAIPDTVTRIGGHAFYANYSLSEVKISKDSQLQEIGSSAFRLCNRLESIQLPYGVYINERAFKESPTEISYYSDSDTGNYQHVTDFGLYGDDNYHWLESPKYGQEITFHHKAYDEGGIRYFTIEITGPYEYTETISEYDRKRVLNEDIEIELIRSEYGSYALKVNYN